MRLSRQKHLCEFPLLFVQILFWHLTDLRGKWTEEAWLFEVLADGLAGGQGVHRGARSPILTGPRLPCSAFPGPLLTALGDSRIVCTWPCLGDCGAPGIEPPEIGAGLGTSKALDTHNLWFSLCTSDSLWFKQNCLKPQDA